MIYGAHWAATRGTPLLPRDLMIAFMYGRAFALTLEDGRIIRPVAARNDVSKSLDMIGSTPGDTLVRGANYWEVSQAPAGQPKAMLSLKAIAHGRDHGSLVPIIFDQISYDSGGFANDPTNPDGFVIPASVNLVQCWCNVAIQNFSGGGDIHLRISLNGAYNFDGTAGFRTNQKYTTELATLSTPPFVVSPGDVLKMALSTVGDSSISLYSPYTTFAISAVS